jgi:hypothetical protein
LILLRLRTPDPAGLIALSRQGKRPFHAQAIPDSHVAKRLESKLQAMFNRRSGQLPRQRSFARNQAVMSGRNQGLPS